MYGVGEEQREQPHRGDAEDAEKRREKRAQDAEVRRGKPEDPEREKEKALAVAPLLDALRLATPLHSRRPELPTARVVSGLPLRFSAASVSLR